MAVNLKVVEAAALSTGLKGGTYINDTTATTGDWFAIQVIEDAVFTLLTAPDVDNIADMVSDGDTLPIGVYYIYCTAITLASGKVIAYNRA